MSQIVNILPSVILHRFLYQLSQVDCLQERAHCFIIQAQFKEQLGILRQHIYTLQHASQVGILSHVFNMAACMH